MLAIFLQNSISQNCGFSSSFLNLETTRVKIRHEPSGTLWWDGSSGRFEVDDPNLSANPISAVFAAELWVLGSNENGIIDTMPGNLFGVPIGQREWWPGPLNDEGQADSETCSNFDKIWEVDAADIDLFKMDFEDNGEINNPIPALIQAWPGKDNPQSQTANGFDLPIGRSLAPFIDRNFDGIYNSVVGDFPDVNGAKIAHW